VICIPRSFAQARYVAGGSDTGEDETRQTLPRSELWRHILELTELNFIIWNLPLISLNPLSGEL
jgi:hypothetical protein